jgi:hypothetical protein
VTRQILSEFVVEDSALAWLGSFVYVVKRGLETWNPTLHYLLVDGVTVVAQAHLRLAADEGGGAGSGEGR